MRLKLPRVREGLKEERLRTRGKKDRDQEERGTEIQKEGNTDLKDREGQETRELGRVPGRQRFSVGQGRDSREKKDAGTQEEAPLPPGYCSPSGRGVGGEWGCLELCTGNPTLTASSSPQACPSCPCRSGPRSWPSQESSPWALPSLGCVGALKEFRCLLGLVSSPPPFHL